MSIILLFIFLFSLNIVLNFDKSSLEVNHFENQKYLYYVNAMNTENGDVYFEFWNNYRFFIGKDNDTKESIKFGDEEIFSIDSQISSQYHDSMIVNIDGQNYVLSMNYQYLNIIDFNNNIIIIFFKLNIRKNIFIY